MDKSRKGKKRNFNISLNDISSVFHLLRQYIGLVIGKQYLHATGDFPVKARECIR